MMKIDYGYNKKYNKQELLKFPLSRLTTICKILGAPDDMLMPNYRPPIPPKGIKRRVPKSVYRNKLIRFILIHQ